MQQYSVIVIDEQRYTISTKLAGMLKAICQDDRMLKMSEIAFDWVRLSVHRRGSTYDMEVTGGTRSVPVDGKPKM